jgi:hypothetical protein
VSSYESGGLVNLSNHILTIKADAAQHKSIHLRA